MDSGPIFFLSYCRPKQLEQGAGPPREVLKPIMQLFDDLSLDVNELVGSVPGRDPGYVDIANDGSEIWRKKLLRAVGTCQVFVCLLSPNYLTSRWCAREWDAFSRRQVVPRTPGGDPDQSAIIPVVWSPVRRAKPPKVSAVDLFVPTELPDADFRARYLRDGLLGLRRTGQQQVYQTIVWRLAMHIERIQRNYHVEPLKVDDVDDLRSSFEEDDS